MRKNVQLFILLITPFFILSACKGNEEGEGDQQEIILVGEPYTNKEVGWTTTVPDGWDILSKDQLDANMENGVDIIEENSDYSIDYSGLKQLINFKKDDFNQFLSSIEPFDLEYPGEWEENNALVYGFLYETIYNQGVPIDTTTRMVKIDGLDFHVLNMTIYSNDGQVVMHEDMYGRLINGYDFSVIITYNNTADQTILEQVLMKSKFTIRD